MTILPFTEGKNALDVRSITYVSNSMDTSALDQFRQGTELTLDKYFQLGTFKIWSGQPNHNMDLFNYGQKDDVFYSEDTGYEDIAKFDVALYLTDYYSNQPIVIDSAVDVNEQGMDGIIEPLTIRRVVSFTSIEAPFESHGVKGSFESGNSNPFRNSDLVICKYNFKEYDLGDCYYEDNVDMAGTIPTNIGFWPTISTRILAFDDTQSLHGIILAPSGSSTINNALAAMTPSSENYLPSHFISTAASLYDYRDWYQPN